VSETPVGANISRPRRIWLCADDYGISPAVNAAIRDLLARRRINATSVMVAAPSLHRKEARALAALIDAGERLAIGLHLTLTAPFHPLSKDFVPLREDAFLSVGNMLVQASLHRLDRNALRTEVLNQVRMFIHAFDREPDFIDGHQHVQLFPQVREAVLTVAKDVTRNAWVRQCGSVIPLAQRWRDPKGMLVDRLSRSFRRQAQALGVRTNPAFAGTYSYHEEADFAALFPSFLEGLPDGSVVMCHPGCVDAELRRLDPLTTLREREYAFLGDDAFPQVLARQGVALA
jgi:predicted glycoside hydrolase/deacetylase ChbG (UPF0249 family)